MNKMTSLFCSLALSGALLTGCATSAPAVSGAPVNADGRWILLPSINNSETPQAGGRLDSITASLLHTHGVSDLGNYPASQSGDNLFENADRRGQEAALAWAMKQDARYAVAGTVEEWRYKVGIDGAPAVGVTLSIIRLDNGKVIWTGSGARTGSSREAVSGVAQALVYSLLDQAIHHEN
ncbi:MAG TPA: hypothetical protein VFW49_03495 [Fluviicoccus sp.]|nr:hypothetical protein [Fluviicoccus sp.]